MDGQIVIQNDLTNSEILRPGKKTNQKLSCPFNFNTDLNSSDKNKWGTSSKMSSPMGTALTRHFFVQPNGRVQCRGVLWTVLILLFAIRVNMSHIHSHIVGEVIPSNKIICYLVDTNTCLTVKRMKCDKTFYNTH